MQFTSNFKVFYNYSSPEFLSKVGSTRLTQLISPYPFAHCSIDYAPSPGKDAVEELATVGSMICDNMNSFLHGLWFIKDCCSHLAEGIFYYPKTQSCVILPNTKIYTSASGKNDISVFDEAELAEAENISIKYKSIISPQPEEKPFQQ
ncbi:MAG: hypothetical protein LH478_08205 [Chitinophagaceae bacterium]|nr:hypothetical protein [Chitinophagaceae bacterium]